MISITRSSTCSELSQYLLGLLVSDIYHYLSSGLVSEPTSKGKASEEGCRSTSLDSVLQKCQTQPRRSQSGEGKLSWWCRTQWQRTEFQRYTCCMGNFNPVHICHCLGVRFLKGNCQSCCRSNGIKEASKLLNDKSAAAIECVSVAFHLFPCITKRRVSFSDKSRMAFSFHIPLTPPHGRWRILLPVFVAVMELIGKETGSLVGCKRHFRHPDVI